MVLSAFPWFGGKTNMARWIAQQLPDHLTYVEPFGGSASVLLNKPRSDTEVYNDKDGDVVHFFRVARERSDELSEWVRTVPYAESQYHDWWDTYYVDGERPDDDVERAGKWLFLRYSNFSGHVAEKRGFRRDSANDPRGGRESQNWTKVPDRISKVADRLRGVTILCDDFHDVIERYDTSETVCYLDPPYFGNEEAYNETADHIDVAGALGDLDGFALVSYMKLPQVFDRDEWTVLEKNVVHRGSGTGEEATERLLCNFDPATVPRFTDCDQATLGQSVAATDGGSQ